MVTMTINPLHSSSTSYFSSSISPAKTRSLAATLNLHEWLFLVKFSRIRYAPKAQQLSPRHSIIAHRESSSPRVASSSNLVTEIDRTLFSILLETGVTENEAELLLENNPVLKIRSADSIRIRVQSLLQLGVSGFAFSRMILKHPDLLTAREVDPLISLIRDDLKNEIEPAQIERLLNATEPRFFAGFEGKVKLLLHHGVPKEKLVHVLNNVNLTKAFCLKSVAEIERTISFLNRYGGVDLILRRPAILNYDLDTQLIPRIGYLNELSGRDEEATSIVLRKLPAILAYTDDHLRDHVDFLKSFAGLTDEQIFKIVLVYPNLFSASRKRKLHPRVDFLKQCGLDSTEIFKFLIKAPLFLSLSFEDNLAYKLVFLIKIGYENRTRDLAMALGAVTRTSSKNLQEAVGLFLYYGLSCEDILAMSKKHPQILQYNHKSLGEKMDYLIQDMGREVGELLAFPAFLGYKLDSRIKHRFEVRRKILGEGMSLNKLLSESTEKFLLKEKKEEEEEISVL